MENTSRSENEQPEPVETDPKKALDLLDRAQSRIAVDQMLDFGPWWYALVLATAIGGGSLFTQDRSDPIGIAGGIVAIAAAAGMAIHDHRRRRVQRIQSWNRGSALMILFVILIVCWVLITAWSMTIISIGYEQFVSGYALLAWVLTSIVLLGIRSVTLKIRQRLTPLQ